eukprot:scaffold389_cov211-Alexandrium_tamarense.AAC.12
MLRIWLVNAADEPLVPEEVSFSLLLCFGWGGSSAWGAEELVARRSASRDEVCGILLDGKREKWREGYEPALNNQSLL